MKGENSTSSGVLGEGPRFGTLRSWLWGSVLGGLVNGAPAPSVRTTRDIALHVGFDSFRLRAIMMRQPAGAQIAARPRTRSDTPGRRPFLSPWLYFAGYRNSTKKTSGSYPRPAEANPGLAYWLGGAMRRSRAITGGKRTYYPGTFFVCQFSRWGLWRWETKRRGSRGLFAL